MDLSRRFDVYNHGLVDRSHLDTRMRTLKAVHCASRVGCVAGFRRLVHKNVPKLSERGKKR